MTEHYVGTRFATLHERREPFTPNAGEPMRVTTYDVDQTTGRRTLRDDNIDIHDLFDAEDEGQRVECLDAMARIEVDGEAWVGGGASELVVIVPADDASTTT